MCERSPEFSLYIEINIFMKNWFLLPYLILSTFQISVPCDFGESARSFITHLYREAGGERRCYGIQLLEFKDSPLSVTDTRIEVIPT